MLNMLLLRQTRPLQNCLRALQGQRYFCSQVADNAARLQPGQQFKGYTVKSVVPVQELNLTAVMLTHDATQAEHLHVAKNDADNAFGVAFRTTPRDDTGVPHILEHTTLCGSEKFPVRDPFFKMLTRSLSTFMNAFTASDWTMYPFSTQNPQDFRNLLSVYLDAVFFPRLRQLDFMQEGWRLEHQQPQDPDTPIIFKGVVYNEMKGVFSNAQHVFAMKSQNLLMPNHTYSVVSGGDPAYIPDLTWNQLRDFHARHYHPSNARFYTYGNMALEDHLDFINSHALSHFNKSDPDTAVPCEPRWSSPRESRITCNPDPLAPDPEKQTTVAVSFLLGDVTEPFESFTASVVGYLLTAGETAPFYRSLLEAGIGSDFAPVHGYSGDTREATFSVGLQGIYPNDVDKVKGIIESTIDQVISEGFEEKRIEGILHKIELGLKHQSDKFGLYLGVGLVPAWNHGGSPTEALQINKQVERFKQCLKDNPRFLQDQVKRLLKENQHRLTLVMSPDENFEVERQREEQRVLQQRVDQLSEADRKEIYEKGLELAELQMQEEDLSCLPTLKVSDIPATLAPTDTDTIHSGDCPIQRCIQPTNEVTYFRALSNMTSLPEKLKPYVPLFCNVVTKMGAGDLNYMDLSQEIDLKTGGLSASTLIAEHSSIEGALEQGVVFSSYSLDRNVANMFELWQKIFNSLDLSDSGRLKTLVLMSAVELANGLGDSGHSYAMTHAASSLTPAATLKEQMSGITQVTTMKKIAEMADLSPVVQSLSDIAQHLLCGAHLRCSINATPVAMETASRLAVDFVSRLRQPESRGAQDDLTTFPEFWPEEKQTHFELPFQVNYVGRSVTTVPYTHQDFPSLRILARMMTGKFLHREIREKGGAYGGGAVSSTPGTFSFYSYRDPSSTETLAAFDAAVTWAADGRFGQQDIDEAKLAIFQQVDAPQTPGQKGQRLFLHRITDDVFQEHRRRLFDVTKDNLVSATKRYLTPDMRLSSVALLGPHNSDTSSSPQWRVERQSS